MRKGIFAAFWLLGVTSSGAFANIQVGDVQAFYNSSSNFSQGVLDGPVFVFQNTSGSAITNGTFSIVGGTGDWAGATDTFKVGTISPGVNVFVTPGVSNDGGSGHTFFAVTGGVLDTSDGGPLGGGVQFTFSGLDGGHSIFAESLVNSADQFFTPGDTAGPANDKTVSSMNFLGGPDDGPCNDCFGPSVVGNLDYATSTTAVPLPKAGWAGLLTMMGLLAAGLGIRRRRALRSFWRP